MRRTLRVGATSLLKLERETTFWHNDTRIIRIPRLLTIAASAAFGRISLGIRSFDKNDRKLAAGSKGKAKESRNEE